MEELTVGELADRVKSKSEDLAEVKRHYNVKKVQLEELAKEQGDRFQKISGLRDAIKGDLKLIEEGVNR